MWNERHEAKENSIREKSTNYEPSGKSIIIIQEDGSVKLIKNLQKNPVSLEKEQFHELYRHRNNRNISREVEDVEEVLHVTSFFVITDYKGRLCFYTCLSVILFRGGYDVNPCLGCGEGGV